MKPTTILSPLPLKPCLPYSLSMLKGSPGLRILANPLCHGGFREENCLLRMEIQRANNPLEADEQFMELNQRYKYLKV